MFVTALYVSNMIPFRSLNLSSFAGHKVDEANFASKSQVVAYVAYQNY